MILWVLLSNFLVSFLVVIVVDVVVFSPEAVLLPRIILIQSQNAVLDCVHHMYHRLK